MAAMMREMNKGQAAVNCPQRWATSPDSSGQTLLGAVPVRFAWAVGPFARTRLGTARGLLLQGGGCQPSLALSTNQG